jgi:hypothetical protein
MRCTRCPSDAATGRRMCGVCRERVNAYNRARHRGTERPGKGHTGMKRKTARKRCKECGNLQTWSVCDECC